MDLKIPLKLYNTLTRKKQIFKPIEPRKVKLYTCGITAYWFAHIGNLRTYIFEDILKRILEYNGYKVKHVMNITDVGHLTSDADTGEDKMEKGAKREGKTAWEIAEFYTQAFKKDLKKLNIKTPDIWVKATDTIKDQIDLIKILEKKGFTYQISDGVYFDTSKLKTYGWLWPRKMKLKAGARVEMVPGKKNPTDFALWKLTLPGIKRQMEWDSPWSRGFPGWHTECVVMSMKHLGIPFDIHCGGIDHILIHHTNEIAQAEAAFSKILANFWLHGEFLILKEENPEGKPSASYEARMAKSKGNITILKNLIEKGVNPIAYRYLCLTTHYRKKLGFSWEALESAQNALDKLYTKIRETETTNNRQRARNNKIKNYEKKFLNFINDDLNVPKALGLMWKVMKDGRLKMKDKKELLLDFDRVFGLNLDKIKKQEIPDEIKKLVEKREKLRKEGRWQEADEIRKKIKSLGWQIEDTKKGPKIKATNNQ
jgi:cysteinyl-tRNA synthetase